MTQKPRIAFLNMSRTVTGVRGAKEFFPETQNAQINPELKGPWRSSNLVFDKLLDHRRPLVRISECASNIMAHTQENYRKPWLRESSIGSFTAELLINLKDTASLRAEK